MIEKGFSKPTARIEKLKRVMLDATPYVESERALLVTQAYKETEGLPPIMRRAKAIEKVFNNLPVTIRNNELIVGAITKHPRSTEICPEFSFDWVEKEFDTMAKREADPFVIPKETAAELHEAFKYWPGKTTSELASSYMSQETKDCMAEGVFTVGNYFFGGVGHVCVDYGKVLKKGFRGIISEVVSAMEKLDLMDPSYIKKNSFIKHCLSLITLLLILHTDIHRKHKDLPRIQLIQQGKRNFLKSRKTAKKFPKTVQQTSMRHVRHSGLSKLCFKLSQADIQFHRADLTNICILTLTRIKPLQKNSHRNFSTASGLNSMILTKLVM